MTKEQIIQIVGKDAVKATHEGTVQVSTVPKTHPAFESYVLMFSPKDGMLKAVAIGLSIKTNGFGETVRSAFVEIQNSIAETYGQPDINLDHLKTGSHWREPKQWMTGLLREERTLAAGWMSGRNRGYGIVLAAKALSHAKGHLELSYEFDGWEQYLDALKKKAGGAF